MVLRDGSELSLPAVNSPSAWQVLERINRWDIKGQEVAKICREQCQTSALRGCSNGDVWEAWMEAFFTPKGHESSRNKCGRSVKWKYPVPVKVKDQVQPI